MFTKSLKKFFAKSKSESFERSQNKTSLSGLRRFFSLDSATTHRTNSTRVTSPSTQPTTSLYRQPLRQRYATTARDLNKPRLITRCRRNFEESHSADEEDVVGEGQWSDDGDNLSDDQSQGRDDSIARSSFSGFMPGVGSPSRGAARGTMLSSASSEEGSTSASCRPRSLSLVATPSSGNGNGGGPSILKQQRRSSRRGGGGGGRGSRSGRLLLRYMQRKSLKKQTSFKEDVDVYYYDDPAGTTTSTAATSPTTPTIPSTHHSSDNVEPASKLFAADVTIGSPDVSTNDEAEVEESSAGILCRYGSSDSVNETETCTESDTSSQCSDTDKLSAAVLGLSESVEKDQSTKCSIRNKRYMLQTVGGKALPASSPLAGTVTVTSADGVSDVSDVLRAVIYVTDRPTRDVKTVVRAMSDGRAIVVTTYETDVLSTSPPRVEKIALPVQVDPFSMKALVQRQGPLVIEAPVVRIT